MTGYEIVNEWMAKGKTSVSDNEISRLGLDGEVALLILRKKYKAKYCESFHAQFCGSWSFENPLKEKTMTYMLYSCDIEEDLKFHHIGGFNPFSESYDAFESMAREIIRIDGEQNVKKEIIKQLKEKKVYVGYKRIWKVQEEMTY